MNKCDLCKYYGTNMCENCVKKDRWEVSLLIMFSAVFVAFGIAGILVLILELIG